MEKFSQYFAVILPSSWKVTWFNTLNKIIEPNRFTNAAAFSKLGFSKSIADHTKNNGVLSPLLVADKFQEPVNPAWAVSDNFVVAVAETLPSTLILPSTFTFKITGFASDRTISIAGGVVKPSSPEKTKESSACSSNFTLTGIVA